MSAKAGASLWFCQKERVIEIENPNLIHFQPATKRPWNKGKLTGQKPPLQPKHVWAIRTRLQLANKIRDLALFNVAIDSKLRGCDVVRLRAEEIAPNGQCVDRATIRQKKTGRPVKFEITEQTRQSVRAYLRARKQQQGLYLFSSRTIRMRTFRPVSMRDWSRIGSRTSALTPRCSAPIR